MIEETRTYADEKYAALISNIEKGFQEIGSFDKEPALVLLGDTGVGKTSFAALISGHQLQLLRRSRICLDYLTPNENPSLKISHEMRSETKIPIKVRSPEGCVIYDNPGFCDTSYSDEFSNAFYIQRIFETRESVRLVFVVPDSYLEVERGSQFIRSVERLCAIFQSPEELKGCISLVISKVDLKEKNKDDLIENLRGVLQRSMKPEVRTIIGFLSDSVILFPKQPPLLTAEMQTLFRTSLFFKPKRGSTNVVVSNECKAEIVEPLFKNRREALQRLLSQIAERIAKLCDFCVQILVEKAYNPKSLEGKIFKEKTFEIFYPLMGKIHTHCLAKLLALHSFLILEKFLKNILDQTIPVRGFLNYLVDEIEDMFQLFKKFLPDETQHEELLFSTKEAAKHLDFLDKVCGRAVFQELEHFRGAFKQVKEHFTQASEKGLNSFTINEEITAKIYFQTAFAILSSCEQEFPNVVCGKQKALAKFMMGKIESKTNKREALKEYVESHRLDSMFVQTFGEIDSVCAACFELLDDLASEIHILNELYRINIKKLSGSLIIFEKSLNEFVGNNEILSVQYLLTISRILDQQRELIQATPKNFKIFGKIIDEMSVPFRNTQEREAFLNEFSYIYEVFSRIDEKDERWQEIMAFVRQVKSLDIEEKLFHKIKNFSVEKYFELSKEINHFQSLIELTLKSDVKFHELPLNEDPEVKKVRIEAYHTLATLFFAEKNYEQAFRSCLAALQGDPKLEKSQRKLDELYYVWSSMNLDDVPRDVRNQMLDFNVQEFRKIIAERIVPLLVDFKEKKGKFFNFYEDKGNYAEICFLEDLREVFFQINENKDYLQQLKKIFEIWKPQMKLEIRGSYFHERNIFEDRPQIGLAGILAHYAYILKIENNDKPEFYQRCFENDDGKPFLGEKLANEDFLINKISNFPLNENLNDQGYYSRLIKFIGGRYQDEIRIMRLSNRAGNRLAHLQTRLSTRDFILLGSLIGLIVFVIWKFYFENREKKI